MATSLLTPPSLSGGIEAVAARLRPSAVAIRSGNGFGTGTVWPGDGIVVTNAHVVGRGQDVLVLSDDGVQRPGRVVAIDRKEDLALVQLADGGLAPVEVGDVSLLRPGALVLAVGNPLGQPGAVTAGVLVSAVTEAGGGRQLVRADLRLAPGNSGGPLADAEGRVIGINAMVYGGLGLAIPSATVTAFLAAANIALAAA